MRVRARLYLPKLVYGPNCYWELKTITGTSVTIESDNVYASEQSARRAAKRWAKKHNIAIVEEGE
jgi:hypothetical protein